MKNLKLTGVLALLLTAFVSFSQLPAGSSKNRMACVVISGATITTYSYNDAGQVTGEKGINGWRKFSYDEQGRLSRCDRGAGPDHLSSSVSPFEKLKEKKVYTPENSPLQSYDVLEYDAQNRVTKINKYYKHNGEFTLSMLSLPEYDKRNHIIKNSLRHADGTVISYNSYEYDKKGNVVHDQYYLVFYKTYAVTQLVSENFYKYDNHPNPAKNNLILVVNDINTNNITECKYVYHDDLTHKSSGSVTNYAFTYNADGYPLTEDKGKTIWEYVYE